MLDLKAKTLIELQETCKDLGFSKFKAKEIFKFIHAKCQTDFSKLTTIKLAEREILAHSYHISDINPITTQKSKDVKKALFELEDGKRVETVFMDYGGDERKTLCVSTQVGCPIKCEFCASGTMGFQRNLTSAEIISQVYYFARKHKISNIVFMGMGEPFLNYDNVIKAALILNDECGLNIGARRTSISTIGIVAGINKLAQEGKQFRLAWSLVAPNDKLRRKLIPYKALPSIAETVAAIQDYQKKTKRRVMIEYVVLKDINDGEKEAQELVKIAQKFDSHVNLIPYNTSPNSNIKSGNIKLVEAVLKKAKVVVTTRRSFGQEISAACGQLSTKSR